MHRSRLTVLVIAAAVSACSAGDDPGAAELLLQDPTLVARLASERGARPPALPDACGAAPVAARPSAAADQAEADSLAQRGYDAETLGRVAEANALLLRASELDGTNRPAAYHLGRTSEALGDRPGALAAYCRFLSLAPSAAEAAEATARVTGLARTPAPVAGQPAVRVASDGPRVGAPARRRAPEAREAPARRVARTARPSQPREVARAAIEQPAPRAIDDAADGQVGGEVSTTPVPTAPATVPATVSATAPAPMPAVDSAPAVAQTARGGPGRAQRAAIGAVAGAILGAATGRGVKGALIGAAAGGAVGTVSGGRLLPVGRGIRP